MYIYIYSFPLCPPLPSTDRRTSKWRSAVSALLCRAGYGVF